MIVVSDSSPLIHLAILGRLDLLRMKFGEILVPSTVWREVVVEGTGKPAAAQVERSGWIRVKEVKDKRLVHALSGHLDDGESEAIALALEVSADLTLLDERDAREVAEAFGLEMLGVLGFLLWAKKEGLIPRLKPELDRLRKIAGFRISRRLCTWVLREAEEEK